MAFPPPSLFRRRIDALLPPGHRGKQVLRLLLLSLGLSLLLAVPVGAQILQQGGAASSGSTTPLIGRADVHLDTASLEISVSLSQTEDACQTPLHGQVCVRYSVAADEKPVQFGYGLLPSSAVTISGSSISVSLDTTGTGFHHLVGKGGAISVTWTRQGAAPAVTVANRTSTLSTATVTGSIMGHTLSGPALVGSVLLYSSG